MVSKPDALTRIYDDRLTQKWLLTMKKEYLQMGLRKTKDDQLKCKYSEKSAFMVCELLLCRLSSKHCRSRYIPK